ncbi:protein S100-A12-like [Coturnix japonica]|uniref:Protein S100-A12-like n=1 Tax=Coturnix japonica TaxID=93934 RepID=A0A8C2TTQ2_COTJA|nr:protein S100-A12-like [Coturnix japonica]
MSTHSTTPQAKEQQFPGNCTLEKALKAIVNIYHQYSIREGQLDLLNFNDFQTLLTEQAPNFLKVCGRSRPGYLKELFEETDLNKDKEISFEEFTIVLAKVTDDAHHIIHKEDRCKPDSN